MDALQELKIITRVLNSGTIMSIERNEIELHGLEKDLKQIYQFKFCSLFNCITGAIQAALMACGNGHGDTILLNSNLQNTSFVKFIQFLGINIRYQELADNWLTQDIGMLTLPEYSLWSQERSPEMLIVDFTKLNYGMAAAVLLNSQWQYNIIDRLKIFGEQDLKTMHEGKESNSECEPTIQFNYRLSPLVAALIRAHLCGLKRSQE